MGVSLETVVELIDGFIRQSGGADANVTSETRLLADGLIDSFSLIALSARIEDALGVNLRGGALISEDFESPRVLHERLTALGF